MTSLWQYQGHPDQYFGHITYSQHGEDLMILNLFKLMRIEKPSYLDIGAHHPFTISNTALMYQLGSRGVNVEANPNLIEAFKIHRPEDITLNVGVAIASGTKPFYLYDDHSGLNSFSKEEMVKNGVYPKKTLALDTMTVDAIVEKHCGGVYPNLLTIDVEGLDFDILECAKLTDSNLRVVCAEVRRDDNERTEKMMFLKGFVHYCRMGENVIFIRRL